MSLDKHLDRRTFNALLAGAPLAGALPLADAQTARDRILRACQRNGLAFLEACWPENVKQRIDDGVRVMAGGREDAAVIGRAYQGRSMPV
jgi:hypothetical protein